ncbi:nucleotide disphospho-sugar-binding domain-containing protein [Kibdelosporangium persicum]|nr:nucleotide disphospho-sugar-binding domain-containing protein [Kibdelosporangium persicum]
MVPLAQALDAAGHEVRVACRPRFADVVTQAGLTAVPVGRDHDVWQAFGVEPGERAALRAAMLEPYDVVGQDERYITWEYLRSGYEYHVTWWHKMDNLPVISQLVAHAQDWRPDLVIWEPTSYAGPVAAKAVGAAHARLLSSLDIHGVTRGHFLRLGQRRQDDPLAEWLSGYATKYGTSFSEDMVTGQLTIDQLPGSLRLDTGLPSLPMRHTPWRETSQRFGRQRVAVVMDIEPTVRFGGYRLTVDEITAAVAQPDSGECAAVVHDGDLATFLDAVRHGLPQLVLPVYVDQPPLADRIVECGAGLHIHPHTVTAAAVRDSVSRLLHEPSFRDSAAKLRDEMLTMPAPAEVVPRLEELAATHR